RNGAPRTFSVTWEAPEPLRAAFEKHIPPPRAEEDRRRAGAFRPWIRDVRRLVPQIAASEGYFSPTVDVEITGDNRERAIVRVTPGPRATVQAVEIAFQGDIAGAGEAREARRRDLRQAWGLAVGAPMRSDD